MLSVLQSDNFIRVDNCQIDRSWEWIESASLVSLLLGENDIVAMQVELICC